MGYMGFGLQKWIYNLKPRRPFSNDRKSNGDKISRYKREFSLKPNDSQKNIRLRAIGNLAILVIICSIFGYFIYSFNIHRKEVNQIHKQYSKQQDEDAFKFLFNSGREFLNTGNWIRAKSEFELALKIKPENIDANTHYIQTLMILCKNGKIDCILVIEQIEKALKLSEKNKELHKLKSEYFFQVGDTSSAIYELERLEIMNN